VDFLQRLFTTFSVDVVMGGDTIFSQTEMDTNSNEDEKENIDFEPSSNSTFGKGANSRKSTIEPVVEENSILDDIRQLILNAQEFGCWQIGVGGINHPPSDEHAASVLHNLPISSVLDCGIDLWRNLEIDDDELLEIAIRDVSYQIQLHEQQDNNNETIKESKEDDPPQPVASNEPIERFRHRFNPRVDPTVLYLEIKKLTFNLENFLFRIEKHETKRTIFDPTFDGSGSVLVRNVSVRMRVECVKDYVYNSKSNSGEICVPVLQLQELDVSLEQVKLHVQNTGADWLLNKVVEGFGDRFTEIMATNLQQQVKMQIDEALTNLNNYFVSSPDILLTLLDISLDDLEEKVVYV
jgi:hypothetical protein